MQELRKHICWYSYVLNMSCSFWYWCWNLVYTVSVEFWWGLREVAQLLRSSNVFLTKLGWLVAMRAGCYELRLHFVLSLLMCSLIMSLSRHILRPWSDAEYEYWIYILQNHEPDKLLSFMNYPVSNCLLKEAELLVRQIYKIH